MNGDYEGHEKKIAGAATTIWEVGMAIILTKNKKYSGPDEIPSEILNLSGERVIFTEITIQCILQHLSYSHELVKINMYSRPQETKCKMPLPTFNMSCHIVKMFKSTIYH